MFRNYQTYLKRTATKKNVNILLLSFIGLLLIIKFALDFLILHETSTYENSYQKSIEQELLVNKYNDKILQLVKQNKFNSEVVAIFDIMKKSALGKREKREMLKYSELIVNEANRYNIDPFLIVAIIQTESSFRSNIVSYKGAVGLMQLLPKTAYYISDKLDHIGDVSKRSQLFDVGINLTLGVGYLAYLIDKTGSVENAIIAYNYGTGNLNRAINNNKKLPQGYLKKVMDNYAIFTDNYVNNYKSYAVVN